MTIKIGDTVTWKAAGKVSRLDGVKGQLVNGVVTEIEGNDVTVLKNYDSVIPLGLVEMCDIVSEC